MEEHAMNFVHDCGQEIKVPDRLVKRFLECPRCGRSFEVPPLDLSKPVENPALSAALTGWDPAGPGGGSARALLAALMKSHPLTAAKIDPPPQGVVGAGQVGYQLLRKGTKIGMYQLANDAGERLLAVFPGNRQFCLGIPDPSFCAMVWPARGVLSFALENGYTGVMLDPGGAAIIVSRAQIKKLLEGELPPD